MPSFDFPEIPPPPVTSIKFTVPGEPVPKGRHRARIVPPKNKAAFIQFYQDKNSEAYEKRVAWQAQIVMAGKILVGALGVDITAYLPIPQSWSIEKKNEALQGIIYPVSRPDADNFLKCALDAMNGIVYHDDSQVVDMKVSKRYSQDPRLEITIFAV